MKLSTNITHEAHGIDGAETNQFSIKVSAKAFDILIDGLYTYKERAVIRELWSNAFDSHIAAGCASIPFDCHLPTDLDPMFRVRDYGTGLTHEQVMSLYTTLFDSTKDGSNEFVGALGLGSKSPFAITDQFTVIARDGQEKRTYQVSKGADGIPQITLLDRRPSDEARGLEVSLAVSQDRWHTFETEAKDLALGFDPVPDVDGLELETAVPEYMAADNSFGLFREGVSHYYKKVSVRQGCVIYPVGEGEITRPLTDLLATGVHAIIDVPIGAVNMAASREALQMDEPTRKYLERAIQRVANVLVNEIQTRAEECQTELEALRFWYNGGSPYGSLFTAPPRWRGKPLSQTVRLDNDPRWPNKDGAKVEAKRPGRKSRYDSGLFEMKAFNFSDFSNERFVIVNSNETVIRSASRIQKWAEGLYGKRVSVLTDPDMVIFKVMEDRLGLDWHTQVFRVSELPDPGPPARVARAREVGELTGVTDVTHGLGRRPVKLTELPDKFMWFEVARTTASEVDPVIRTMTQYAQCGNFNKLPILTFTSGARKRFKPDPEWNLGILMAVWRFENVERLMDTVSEWEYNQMMRNAGLGPMFDLRDVPNGLCHKATSVLNWQEQEAATAFANEAAALEQERYPLLFEKTHEAVTNYIAMCDANRNRKKR